MLRPSSILTVLLLLCFGCTPSLSASNYAALYDGLNQPVAVVTDSLGYLYVVNYQPPTVIKLAPSGLGAALVTYNTTSTPSILFPTGLCLDSALNVFIVDSGNDRIIKFNNAGVQQLIIASTATNPTLLNPHSCVVDSTGNIFVSNNNGNGAIIKLSSAGTQVAIFTTSSPSLNNTNQIALDSAGSLFIADSNNNRVVKLSSAGVQQPVFTLASNRYPQGVAIDSQGSVYVSMNVVNAGVYATTLLSVFASDGSTLPILTTSIPDLSHLSGLWVDSSFNVFAADTGNSRIVKFYSAQSGFVTANPYSGLNTPSDVAVDSLGALYVVSLNGVMKLQSANSSTILQNYTITTGEPFSVNGARGLCLDTARNVYILDSYNNRVVKFSNDGMVLQIYASNSTTPALVTPFGCVADSLNFLYIYNTVTRSITLTSAGINKMAPNGSQVAFFGSTGLGSAPRSNPKLTIDSAGALLVADPNNYRIVKLDSTTGAVLQNFTMFPAYAVPITPSAVAVDQYGVVYAYAGNIFVFSPSGVLLNELGSNLLGGAGGVAVDGSGHLYATGATQIAIFQTASSITAAVPITSSSSSSSSAAPLSGGSSSSTGRSGGSVVGDPQFVGLLGQSFQVHGIDGQVYNLISRSSRQADRQRTLHCT